MRLCKDYAALLDAFVDGELSGPEEARVRDHLAGCPACAAYAADAMAIRAAFPGLEDTEAPEGLADGVMAAIRADAAPRRKTRRWLRTAVSLAACAAVVFAVWRVIPLGGGGTAGSAAPAAAAGGGAEMEYRRGNMDGVATGGSQENGVSHEAGDTGDGEAEAAGQTAPQKGSSLTMSGAGEAAAPSPGGENPTAADAAAGEDLPPVPQKVLGAEGGDAAGADPFAAPVSGEDGAAAQGTESAREAAAQAAEFQGRTLETAGDPAAYADRLADLDGYVNDVIYSGESGLVFETEGHAEDGGSIAWYGQLYGTPHTDQYFLYLYFADGTVASLPLPQSGAMSCAPPSFMRFEGDAFVYEIVFEDEAPDVMTGAGFYHVEGTYRYTVDLNAKTVSLEIQQ